MHMPPTVCLLLEPTDRHAGHIYRHEALLLITSLNGCLIFVIR
jgi:hypothetical protein